MATSVLHGSVAEPKVSLRRFTIGEYHKLGDAGILRPNDRVELIDGLLIQRPHRSRTSIHPRDAKWIVDIPAKAIRVFRLNQREKYQESRYSDGSIAVQAFPDVLVRLEDVFLSFSAIALTALRI